MIYFILRSKSLNYFSSASSCESAGSGSRIVPPKSSRGGAAQRKPSTRPGASKTTAPRQPSAARQPSDRMASLKQTSGQTASKLAADILELRKQVANANGQTTNKMQPGPSGHSTNV